jgi:hypothetical protein
MTDAVETEQVATAAPFAEDKPAEGPSIEDMAAHDWQEALPAFRKKLQELSNFQLKKVVAALVEHPLEPHAFKWSYPQEKELYEIGAKLLDCKFVIMRAALSMNKEQIEELMKAEAAKGEVKNVE